MNPRTEPIRISVVIPAYNNERWIGRAIKSVLAQSRAAEEIIVVDDGSRDNTAAVAAGFGERVRLIRQDNAGASAARNAGIRAATGNWIAFLDADDEWLPEKLALQIEHLRRWPSLKWTTGNYIECLCESGYRAPAVTPAACRTKLGGRAAAEDYLAAYRRGLAGHTDTMLICRDLLERVGGFRAEQKRFNDLDLWLRIAYTEPTIGYLAEPLAIHHLEAGEHISIRHHRSEVFGELIGRHRRLASETGRLAAFEPLAANLLRGWMRGMLFDPAQAGHVRRLLEEFRDLLPPHVRRLYHVLTAFPKVTAAGCHAISKVIRRLGLRRRAVRKPIVQNQ